MFSRILPPLDRFHEAAAGAPGGTLRLAGDVPVDLVGSRMERFSREGPGSLLASRFSGTENFGSMLAAGIPDKAIVKASRAAAADLIPIGTHGRISVEHVPFGGTAKRIVRAAPRPVPAVRPGASALLRR